ncbi:hypothetical protein [Leptospira kanakyensis]|uniref:Uncharacterized protein n=1 Tax=Leptospira kanakyensis TaxID=2484968 RepID=A0A6N4QLA9_9LEPT|nr:hypothetical protein [Leptospira kanakyensis]MCW7481556.1 hypothetical protein [Leptospira kanakyensis]TGK53906.1 hypothetical protein EHQ11_06165 [Leptospira kanakyensis]TGK57700.1 hypothetical protein EHQ16_17855 [Leptospira kanakyensis]TGK73410.1 hypothetical protein EHQ18_06240 [Leptospira kanakyensis]
MDGEQMETFREELAKTFFLSILKDLSEIGEPLSDYEVKVLIQKALSNSSDLQVEWGDMDRFGNSTLLVKYESNLLLIEASPLISTIRILWNEYQSKEI